MAVSESNIAEFNMAAIINLSQNEWVKFYCTKRLNQAWQISRWLPSSSWIRMNEWSFLYKLAELRIADFKIAAIIKLSQNEWVKVFVQKLGTNLGKCERVCEEKLRWLNPRRPNSRWLPSSSWVRMNEWSFFVQIGWIEDSRFQDSCNHQVESEWMSEGVCAKVGN